MSERKPVMAAQESSACGIGFVATTSGVASHKVLEIGADVLSKMEHRGGVGATPNWEREKVQYEELLARTSDNFQPVIESKIAEIQQYINDIKENPALAENHTSDGRGLMVEVDQDFHKEKYIANGGDTEIFSNPDRDIAVGSFFLPKNNETHKEACVTIIREELAAKGYDSDVIFRNLADDGGVDESVLGQVASNSMPTIAHMLIPQKELAADATAEDIARAKSQFDSDLYFIRKKIEGHTAKYFEEQNFTPEGADDFYVPSMSRQTITYKGLSVADDTTVLYHDLGDPEYKTRFAIPHSRYSTNTAPAWRRAHPYRHIAHNGEINSLQTNINMIGRIERVFATLYPEDNVYELFPVIQSGGTDSAMLDNVVEFLLHAGLTPAAVKMLLVPEAFEHNEDLSPEVKDLYRFIDILTQPFDGPNTMAMAGNGQVVIGGDKSGLRPNRAKRTQFDDGEEILSVLSEDIDLGGQDIEKWNQEPGDMIGIDLNTGDIMRAKELKESVAQELEEKFGIKNFLKRITKLDPQAAQKSHYNYTGPAREKDLKLQQRVGGITQEHREFILNSAAHGKEQLGSMGDEAALAVVSPTYRTFDNLFQQSFSQVTDPPKDTIRERSDMSLATYINSPFDARGRENDNRVIHLDSPILSNATFSALRQEIGEAKVVEISCTFEANGSEGALQSALDRIKAEAEDAAKSGKQIILTDEHTDKNHAAIPMLMAAGAINTHLLLNNLRDQTSLNVRTKQVSYSHGMAALISLGGADTVNAYMAEETIAAEHHYETYRFGDKHSLFGPQTPLSEFEILLTLSDDKRANDANAKLLKGLKLDANLKKFLEDHADKTLEELADHEDVHIRSKFETIMGLLRVSIDGAFKNQSVDQTIKRYIKSSEASLLKTMGKKGISHVSSYRGGRMFEALGVSSTVIEQCFPGVASKVEGLTMDMIQKRESDHHKKQYAAAPDAPLKNVGRWKLRADSADTEPHVFTSEAMSLFQQAVKDGDYEKYKQFRDLILERSEQHHFAPRDWMGFKSDRKPVDIDTVELATDIVKRFFTGAMSYGSIGDDPHETLAIAMNRLGGKSNSGEGGEKKGRLGTNKSSAVKQIASGRFGVHLDYLIDAKVLQIKIAQGAKPGEGGELPGKKVWGKVSITRGVNDGTTLISPPPHHDIYSIEDLEQLIYDLKQVNPDAEIDVKLVSSDGAPIVANGVGKAFADVIHLSGSNGGTGASPQSSISHAGMPVETSLNSVHRSLITEHLRERIKLTADGGMHIGRDIVIMALMGAEEYGFGLEALMAMGCALIRTCQNGDCPFDVARMVKDGEDSKFIGTPEMVENMMMFIAEDIRETLASLGYTSIDDIVGRTDLLEQVWGKEEFGLDIAKILGHDEAPAPQQKCERNKGQRNDRVDPQRPNHLTIDEKLLATEEDAMYAALVGESDPYVWEGDIDSQDRTVGARTSSVLRSRMIEDKSRESKAKEDSLTLKFNGIAGQSFGFALVEGATMQANGANDGVGKSLSGGKIVLTPRDQDKIIKLHPDKNTILGNAALYGATSGQLYAAGRAGNRFAIRMSGGTSVVDGAGSHACNYMTGGTAVFLGSVGQNFGAGMSGGQVFVFDEDDKLERKTNADSRHKVHRIEKAEDKDNLRSIVTKHYNETDDHHAKNLLDDWDNAVQKFKVVNGAEEKPQPVLIAA